MTERDAPTSDQNRTLPCRVTLRPRKARPFFARHPWVFNHSIDRVEALTDPEAVGVEAEVFSHEGVFIARGLFNPRSKIRVRLYRWDDGPLDAAFWKARLSSALQLRSEVIGLVGDGSACRLVFSEADALSGLIVDRYDRWLVVHFTSLALFERRGELLPALAELTGCEGILNRFDREMARLEGVSRTFEPLDDGGSVPGEPITIVESGLLFSVDLQGGQKTGFYLDQRENRRAVAGYARGRSVLDLFCYSGAFALSALKNGGATRVLGIDSSAPAIDLARQNAEANALENAQFEVADGFEALERLKRDGSTFGLVILDPPKYARQSARVEDALKIYLRLNLSALSILEPNGLLVTCSCSGHVSRTMFADLLARVAELSGRAIQILEQRGQSPDHPVSASCLESDYLKCFVCRVV